MTEIATWFGRVDRPLFGWFSVPDDAVASMGVVLCPPMTEEARATHRTFRSLGESLAAQGILALRLDYHGTGDSAGRLSDPGLVEEWRADLLAAVGELKAAGVRRIAAVGMRLGATLAASVAVEAGLSELVLWDPCLSGASFLREGQALHSLRIDPTAGGRAKVPPGAVDTPGFRFGAELSSSLSRLDLAALGNTAEIPRRILVLARGDRPVPAKLRRRLSSDRCEWGDAAGQAELLDVLPSAAVVPEAAMAQVVQWLAAGQDGSPPVPLLVQPAHEAAITSGEGATVIERPVRFGDVGLFGIATEPAAPSARDLPWLLFLNVACEHHIGPGRQWVELAREWAALGYRCVRLDQSGIGDSPVRPGQRSNVAFAPQWLDDVGTVVTQLAADGSRVAIVGLCSGAYSGLEAAFVSPVDAILAVNLRVSTPEMSKASPLYDRRRRADRSPIRPLGRLALRHRRVGGGLWRIYRQFAFWHAPLSSIAKVVRTGTTVRLLANPHDAREFSEVLLWTLFGLPRLRRDPRYRPIINSSVDHSMLTQRGQQEVRRIFTEFLAERYGHQVPAGPVKVPPTVPPVTTAEAVGLDAGLAHARGLG
jgi:alpha-beta hydrolase superfamily lysophospholipase